MANRRKQFRLSSDRAREIIELAEGIADDYFPATKIDPSEIAMERRIGFKFNHYRDEFDGVLEHKNGKFFIYINLDRVEYSESPRARFTFCHELGHYFIDEHRLALESGRTPSHGSKAEFESWNPVEVEADLFASSLLMPTDRFQKRLKKLPVGWAAIDALCREFGTSRTSTAIRYATLTDKPMAVIKWNTDGYSWKWLSSGFFDASLRKTIESTDSIIQGSATTKALSGQPVPACGYFQSGTVASAWFPFISYGSARNAILVEQAKPIGKFGVLTLLYPGEDLLPSSIH